jgi:hypothetical protein
LCNLRLFTFLYLAGGGKVLGVVTWDDFLGIFVIIHGIGPLPDGSKVKRSVHGGKESAQGGKEAAHGGKESAAGGGKESVAVSG